MIFIGLSKVFDTKNNNQYITIGAFWDKMSNLYGKENLRGLGYNWNHNTIEYVIGLKNNKPIEEMDGCLLKTIILPDNGWLTYHGLENDLQAIYERIYKNGPLTYEIETFNNDGSCEIKVTRSRFKKYIKHTSRLTGEDIDMFNEKRLDDENRENICDSHIDGF